MELEDILKKVKIGELSIEDAVKTLKKMPYEELGFAKLDHHRKVRKGYGEVILCEGKSKDHLINIFKHFAENDVDVLGTRASKEQFESIKEIIENVEYDDLSRILKLKRSSYKNLGNIAICTGGTSDIPVAEEAAQTAEFFGSKVLRIYDVGVAGIHRLLSKVDEISSANCIIAVAGMEGALPGVIAGMVDKPVIAVPTSVGYGTNFNGISSLLTMLNSCAEGIAVVNIDNGFGAGYIANQINQLVVNSNGK
ncbi:MAG: nickel pincer cofactor biosynthesis protein LarB [Tissierellales bacterium]|nr:nickel pincer cofactor biosynthesis protein LarB [Tissierellales bacterium]